MRAVIDTNVLVSALWSENNRLTRILELILLDILTVCYNAEIMQEYREVLRRPRFASRFNYTRVGEIIDKIAADGLCVAVRRSTTPQPDEDDRCFYDVAAACNAVLVTDNIRHFANVAFAMTSVQFLDVYFT